MKKRVALLLENYFDDEEVIYPYHRLLEDFDVDIIGTEADTIYRGKGNFPFKSEKASRDVNAEDYDALFIPGGFSPDYMRRSEDTVNFAKKFDEAKKPIAAVCHAGWMLISSADIKGRTLTSHPAIKKDMENAGAKWIDKESVRSDHIITCRRPADLHFIMEEFKQMILEYK